MRLWHAINPAQKLRDANEQAKLRYVRKVLPSRVALASLCLLGVRYE